MSPVSASASPERLARVVGTFGLAAAIVNITIGGGIFRLPANVAGSLGAAAPLAYIVCAVAMGLIVLCMADAGSRISLTGGPYAYVGTAFGDYAGFISGLLLWMLGTFAGAAVSTVFASSVGLLIPSLAGRTGETAVLVLVFAFWTWINLRGVALASRLNTVATVAKLLPLLLVAIGGLFFIQTENLTWTAAPAAADIARTSVLLIFAFAGIECALVPSGEVRDTARTVPRAIALAMGGVTVLYLWLQIVAQGVLGPGLAQATASPLADTAQASLGGWARTVLLAGASISMFGYIGAVTMSIPRMLYAFARDGFLPKSLAEVHPSTQSPTAAIIVQSTLTLALALSGTFENLALLANVAALVLYFGCALAAWKLRADGVTTGGQKPLKIPFVAALPWVTCLVIIWLLTGIQQNEWIAFGVCVAVGSLAYLLRAKRVVTA
jgi:APA family basic amino acid/polyamine antiporter